jgi:hypothetical protein
VSPEKATIIAGVLGIVGALLGTFLGLVGERILRSMGRIRYEPGDDWTMQFMVRDDMGGFYAAGPEKAVQAERVDYAFSVDLFNGKEIPTALRAVKVVLECKGGELSSTPHDRTTTRQQHSIVTSDKVDVINFQPRQFVHLEVGGSFTDPLKARGWTRALLKGKRPKRDLLLRKTYTKVIASRPSFPGP